MDVDKSFMQVNIENEEIFDIGDDVLSNIKPISCVDTSNDNIFLFGSAAASITRVILNENNQQIKKMNLFTSFSKEEGIGNIQKNISSPIKTITLVPKQQSIFLFSLWQSNQILFSTFDQSENLVISLSPTVRSRFNIGAIESLTAYENSNQDILCAVGTDNGWIFVFNLNLETQNIQKFGLPLPDPQMILQHHDINDKDACEINNFSSAIFALHFFNRNKNGNDYTFLASGSGNGYIKVWGEPLDRIESNSDNIWNNLFNISVERSQITVLKTFKSNYSQIILSSAENGSIKVWDLDSIFENDNQSGIIASMGNYDESVIHSVYLGGYQTENVDKNRIEIIAGDDSGFVSVYLSPFLTKENDFRLKASEPWEMIKKWKEDSPVISTCYCKRNLMIATCENGIIFKSSSCTNNETIKTIQKKFDSSNNFTSDSSVLSNADDSNDESDKFSFPSPLPRPIPIKKPFDPGYNHKITKTLASASKKEHNPKEEVLPDDDNDDKDVDIRSNSSFDSYFEKNTCYDGFIDQDIPPLPLTKYHEPSLNSSEKILAMIEKLKLKRFEEIYPEIEEEYASTTGPSKEQNDNVQKGTKLFREVATKTTNVEKSQKLYQGLTSIDLEKTPIFKPTQRIKRRHGSKKYKRKSILERQNEEIEKHRLQRLAKELEEQEKEEKKEENTNIPSPPPPPIASTEIKEAKQENQENVIPWLEENESFSWANKEFYLTKFEDGNIGFNNYRSLSFQS